MPGDGSRRKIVQTQNALLYVICGSGSSGIVGKSYSALPTRDRNGSAVHYKCQGVKIKN